MYPSFVDLLLVMTVLSIFLSRYVQIRFVHDCNCKGGKNILCHLCFRSVCDVPLSFYAVLTEIVLKQCNDKDLTPEPFKIAYCQAEIVRNSHLEIHNASITI